MCLFIHRLQAMKLFAFIVMILAMVHVFNVAATCHYECDWHPEPKVEETGVHPSEDGADDGDGGRLDDQAREESRGELHQQLQSLK